MPGIARNKLNPVGPATTSELELENVRVLGLWPPLAVLAFAPIATGNYVMSETLVPHEDQEKLRKFTLATTERIVQAHCYDENLFKNH